MVIATRPTTLTSLSLSELISRFLQECRGISSSRGRRLSPHTVDTYRMCLGGLNYFAQQQSWPDPAEITREHLRDFIEYVATEPRRWGGDGRRSTRKAAKAGTINRYGTVVKTFFRWALDEGYLEEAPALLSLLRFRLPHPDSEEVAPYTDEEVGAMLAACEQDLQRGDRYLGARNRAIISVFVDTGMRLDELAGMKLSELDPHLQQIRILGKGNRWRTLTINGEARKNLKIYLTQFRRPAPAGEDAVWLTDDGPPMTYHGVKIMLARLKRQAGVKSGGGAHRFRHYFATRYLENGGDMNNLRMLLGHRSLSMVLRYTRFVRARHAFEEHRQLSPLDSLVRGNNHNHRDDSWGWRG